VRDPKRMTPEGRADTEPVAPNDTPANRALNRRVEIFVFEQEEL
jgi:type VI secretion system protein ImpK